MKRIKKALMVCISVELVALAYVLFIIPNGFISFGVDGIASLIYLINGVNPAINLIIINSIILLLSSILADNEDVKKYMIPALLVPLFIFINMIILKNYSITLPETSLNGPPELPGLTAASI